MNHSSIAIPKSKKISTTIVLFTIMTTYIGCTNQKKRAEQVFSNFATSLANNNESQAYSYFGAVTLDDFQKFFDDVHKKYNLTLLNEQLDTSKIKLQQPIKMYTIHEFGYLPQRDHQGGYDLPVTVEGHRINHITERSYIVPNRLSGNNVLIKITIAWGGNPKEPTINGLGFYEASDLQIDL